MNTTRRRTFGLALLHAHPAAQVDATAGRSPALVTTPAASTDWNASASIAGRELVLAAFLATFPAAPLARVLGAVLAFLEALVALSARAVREKDEPTRAETRALSAARATMESVLRDGDRPVCDAILSTVLGSTGMDIASNFSEGVYTEEFTVAAIELVARVLEKVRGKHVRPTAPGLRWRMIAACEASEAVPDDAQRRNVCIKALKVTRAIEDACYMEACTFGDGEEMSASVDAIHRELAATVAAVFSTGHPLTLVLVDLHLTALFGESHEAIVRGFKLHGRKRYERCIPYASGFLRDVIRIASNVGAS